MKVLVTGFTPFGGETVNPSYEAVRALPKNICDNEIITARLTTEFGTSYDELLKLIKKYNPDAIVCVGQAGGRSAVTVEKIAINYAVARDADKSGVIIENTINPNGKAAYFTTLNAEKLVAKVCAQGIPCALSLSAGSFVCNYIMYRLLEATENDKIRAGFVHIPYCPDQAIGKNPIPPTMELDTAAKALTIIIENIFSE